MQIRVVTGNVAAAGPELREVAAVQSDVAAAASGAASGAGFPNAAAAAAVVGQRWGQSLGELVNASEAFAWATSMAAQAYETTDESVMPLLGPTP
jgi:hypothetical protein